MKNNIPIISTKEVKGMEPNPRGVTKFVTCISKEMNSMCPKGEFTKVYIDNVYTYKHYYFFTFPFSTKFSCYVYDNIKNKGKIPNYISIIYRVYIKSESLYRKYLNNILNIVLPKYMTGSIKLECLDNNYKLNFVSPIYDVKLNRKHIVNSMNKLQEYSNNHYDTNYMQFINNK